MRCGSRTAFVIVKEIVGQREGFVFVQSQVTGIRHPVAVDSFMVNQQTERFALVTFVLHPIDSVIGNQVGNVPMSVNGVVVLSDKVGVIIVTLSGHNLPIIES